ncbi:MAG: sigma-70 family RNA polymerase sigma factor [Saprospiraceae bacterium]|nr:sigma-70 family RNA polymerase sigma factor [Saprospiraceae bacterium]
MRLRLRHHHSELSDEQLVETYRRTLDTSVLGILYDRYIELVYGTCYKYLKHAQDSEDAAMSVLASLQSKLKAHEITHFRGWLYVLTRNHCLQILRQRKMPLTELNDAHVVHLAEEMHPDDRILLEHQENGLRECLGKLPERQKRSLELFYYEAKSYQEIADQLSVSKDKIRSFIQNGRRNLKICMEKKHAIRTTR